ncbi:hypothetical protein SLA2020_031650 [Shorea laevis]
MDNIFSLRLDFTLCRNDDSSIECWSEGSNWGMIDEEESWDQCEAIKEEDKVEKENNLESAWAPESSSSEEEFENVLETLEPTENAINAGRLLSNQQRGEGLKENIMIEQWGVEPRTNGRQK